MWLVKVTAKPPANCRRRTLQNCTSSRRDDKSNTGPFGARLGHCVSRFGPSNRAFTGCRQMLTKKALDSLDLKSLVIHPICDSPVSVGAANLPPSLLPSSEKAPPMLLAAQNEFPFHLPFLSLTPSAHSYIYPAPLTSPLIPLSFYPFDCLSCCWPRVVLREAARSCSLTRSASVYRKEVRQSRR